MNTTEDTTMNTTESTSSVTTEWCKNYCKRLMHTYGLVFPFYVGRLKVGGYVDARVLILDEDMFVEVYKDFDAHPRVRGINLYTTGDKIVSI